MIAIDDSLIAMQPSDWPSSIEEVKAISIVSMAMELSDPQPLKVTV